MVKVSKSIDAESAIRAGKKARAERWSREAIFVGSAALVDGGGRCFAPSLWTAAARRNPRGELLLFEGRPDFVEHRADPGPHGLDRGNNEDCDERGDQRILDCGDARLVGGEGLHRSEHWFAPAPKPDPAATPVLAPPAWGPNLGSPDFGLVNLSGLRRSAPSKLRSWLSR